MTIPTRATPGPIVFVEDDLDDQYIILSALKEVAIANPIRFFDNAQEVLDYLWITTEQPLLILSDVHMPLMSGLELRQRIQSEEYLRQKAIPFVFLSTQASVEVVETAYALPVQGFYQKPTVLTDLSGQLRLIVDYWQHCLHPSHTCQQ